MDKRNIREEKHGNMLGTFWNTRNKICQNKIFNFFFNLILAIGTVIPFMIHLCRTIVFTYEVNDDATIVQILDGSYTGTPDGHAIFIKYPLSWIIKSLYEINPDCSFQISANGGTNWYVTTVVFLEIFALIAVLFRILNYFRCNRIFLCFIYHIAFIYLWMPCFFNLTFSTVAAFLGCMCLLFVGFSRKEELWRPWNLVCFGILAMSSYCMRKQCFYMVVPFLLIEVWFKYRTYFFRSVKPWFIVTFCGILGAGILFLNTQMYSSMDWKNYFIYNHARAYLQDYTGMPDYESNQDFYHSIGIGEKAQNVLKSYSYCLYDDFSTEKIEKIYNYQKSQEPQLSLEQKIKNAKKKAERFCLKKKQTGEALKYAGFYMWILLIPLTVITFLFKLRAGFFKWLSMAISIGMSTFFIHMEWIYLAMNGRFPQRVEESIRILTFTVGFLLVSHLLKFWENTSFIQSPLLLQIIFLAVILHMGINGNSRIKSVQGAQISREQYCAQKAEIAAYCGKYGGNYYILDTQSFGKPSGVKDNLHQGNWFMSGSWTAYSPLYKEKLARNGIDKLGTNFLLQKNVYIITKGKKNVLNLLGLDNTEHLTYKAVDEIEASGNLFYAVYKVSVNRR